ncbi:MAG TPA: hypothetical protein VIL09_11980 [Microvirga sp.]|jgi:hypothetical protein
MPPEEACVDAVPVPIVEEVPPVELMDEEPVDPVDVPMLDEPAPMVEEPVAPGCMAGEPVDVEPEPVAVGRSVPADGAGGVWARTGAAANAVATRQAAICFFSILIS